MAAGNFILSLEWRSLAGAHVDCLYLAGVDLASKRLGPFVCDGMAGLSPGASMPLRSELPASLPGDIRPTSLYGWKHTPPHLGRYYPRGLLNAFPRVDLRPFRVLALGDKDLTADFNPPLAGVALSARIRLVEFADAVTEDVQQRIDAWLTSGPGMQAPLPEGDTDFLAGRPFARADETPDENFYARERLVDHLDEITRTDLNACYQRHLRPGMQVLDLMASWNSHLPAALPLTVTGLGMNETELARNPRLAERVVHDLNCDPELPFGPAQFDAALCALSIEYLVDPVAVMGAVGRVLKPGAPFVVGFSDRWFPPKAIRLWSELHPFERLAFVADLMRRSGQFARIDTETLLGRPAPLGNWRPKGRPHADPLFVVTGYRTDPCDSAYRHG